MHSSNNATRAGRAAPQLLLSALAKHQSSQPAQLKTVHMQSTAGWNKPAASSGQQGAPCVPSPQGQCAGHANSAHHVCYPARQPLRNISPAPAGEVPHSSNDNLPGILLARNALAAQLLPHNVVEPSLQGPFNCPTMNNSACMRKSEPSAMRMALPSCTQRAHRAQPGGASLNSRAAERRRLFAASVLGLHAHNAPRESRNGSPPPHHKPHPHPPPCLDRAGGRCGRTWRGRSYTQWRRGVAVGWGWH